MNDRKEGKPVMSDLLFDAEMPCSVCQHEGCLNYKGQRMDRERDLWLCEFCADTFAGLTEGYPSDGPASRRFVAEMIAQLYWKLKGNQP
jgi:hypothetical protein